MANKYRLKFTLSDGNTIDAGEIVVPEGAKGDKGDKGDTYTLTAADKAAIVQDVLAALPYYDGSVTISGGVELISFTIDGDHYEAEDGMTWGEWVASDYNTGGFVDYNGDINIGGGFIYGSQGRVSVNDIIQPDYAYEVHHGSGN